MTKKTRAANLDLLRIVSMLLIVFLHSIDHSGVLENAANCGTGMYFYVRFTYALCQVCVNIYIMLSGYFMVESRFRFHKLVTLWMETVFYGFTLKLIFMLAGLDEFSVTSLLSCFLPILSGRYWFLTIYVGMYLVSPFLNTLIRAMDKKQHSLLNLCLFLIFSLWVSIHPKFAGMNSGGGWGLAWFVVLYLTAAWFRLYYQPDGKWGIWMAGYFLIPACIALAQCLPLPGIIQTVVGHWFRYDSAPVYLMTLCLFVGFLNVHIRSEALSRRICTIAPLTLGVYLIHAHANVSPWSWKILALPEKMNGAVFPVIQMAAVLGIFVICIGIDAVRKVTVGSLESAGFVKKSCTTIENHVVRWLDAIL